MSSNNSNDQQEEQEDEQNEEHWIDITSLIQDCAASLSFSNPTLHNDASFSLHDTMAALELMDPKMDCCELRADLIHPSNPSSVIIPPRPIPTSLIELPWDELTLQDATDVSLEILTRLESLLCGASVAESTYTCLYAHAGVLRDMKQRLMSMTSGDDDDDDATNNNKKAAASSLDKQLGDLELSSSSSSSSNHNNTTASSSTTAQWIVYAATLGLVEISDVLRSIVLHADIYEEEDFSVNTFGLSFVPDGPQTMATLQQALALLTTTNDVESTTTIPRLILSYQLSFLQTCTSMAKLSAAPARQVTSNVKQLVAEGVANLQQLQDILESQQQHDAPIAILTKCFDPYVYRPLVGSSPVRKVAFHTPLESIPILKRILAQVDWAVCDLILSGGTLMQIRRLLHRISLSAVNILSRSLIVLNLYFDDKLLGQHVLSELIGNYMVQLTGLDDDDDEFNMESSKSKFAQAFLNRLAKPMYDTLKLMVLNRNRQRTYMEAIMFQDWASLQQEAHMVDMQHRQENDDNDDDDCHHPPYFTQYALYMTVWLMDHHVALGIELQLFTGQHDLAVAYWYRDFLLSSLLNTLSSIRATKKASLLLLQKKKSKQQQNGGNKVSNNNSNNEDVHEDLEIMIVGFKRTLCRGLVRFIASLNQAELVEKENYEFTMHEKRFEKRFEPFLHIVQPPPLTYDDFQSGSDFSNVPQSDLLSSTLECFKRAKTMLDKITTTVAELEERQGDNNNVLSSDEIRAWQKISVGNSVFLMKLTQLVQDKKSAAAAASATKVTFDFNTDAQYCIIKLG